MQLEAKLPKCARQETADALRRAHEDGVLDDDTFRTEFEHWVAASRAAWNALSTRDHRRSRFWVEGRLYCRFDADGQHSFWVPGVAE